MSKNLLWNPRSWIFAPMFPPKSFIVFVPTFRSLIHYELVLVYSGKNLASCFCIQLSQHCFLTRLFFPHWLVLAPCWKSAGHRNMGLFLDCQLFSLVLYVCPCARPTLWWLLLLCSKFWNWECVLKLRSESFPVREKVLSSFSGLFWLFWILSNFI